MIAKKLLACAPANGQPTTVLLATWTGATGAAPAADIGIASGSGSYSGGGTLVVPPGGGICTEIQSAFDVDFSADWCIDLFFHVDSGGLPPIFFVAGGGIGERVRLYRGQLSVLGVATAAPVFSTGLHHIALGRQAGMVVAWVDGVQTISAAAIPGSVTGSVIISLYGSGSGAASSAQCEWDDVRVVSGQIYSGSSISVPALPLGII